MIRIVLENKVRLPLLGKTGALTAACDRVGERDGGVADPLSIFAFLQDRLKVYLRDDGIRHDVIDACFALDGQDDLVALVGRIRAVNGLVGGDAGENLIQGYRRAVNILEAEEKKDGVEYSLDPDPKLAESDAERDLFAALNTAQPAISDALSREAYADAIDGLAGLRAPVDAFFEATMINAENAILRRNRLCLLNRIRVVMGQVADFGALDGG